MWEAFRRGGDSGRGIDGVESDVGSIKTEGKIKDFQGAVCICLPKDVNCGYAQSKTVKGTQNIASIFLCVSHQKSITSSRKGDEARVKIASGRVYIVIVGLWTEFIRLI
jgi:hypothetical protein